jgi:ketosteroid isomerase-like protein
MAVMEHSDEKKIRQLDAAWGDAACKKELEAVVAFYAPNGSLVWPGAPAAHGTAKIRAAWSELLKISGLALRFTPERIDIAQYADIAVDFGRVDFQHDAAKGRVEEISKYVVVWKKIDGTWKVLYDCYNANTADA